MIILFLVSCHKDSPANLMIHSPKCSIVSKSGIYKDKYRFSYIDFVIENNGEGPTAYNIHLYVKLKMGNLIVSQNTENAGSLLKDESVKVSVLIPSIEENIVYDNIDTHLYWYDSEGTFYD